MINGRVIAVPSYYTSGLVQKSEGQTFHAFLLSVRLSRSTVQMLFMVALTFRDPFQAEA